MKFIIPAKDFKRALGTCNEVAPASSSIAEEKTGVLIKAQNDSVVFMSSDESSYVQVVVPATVKSEGEALVRVGAVASSVSATFLEDDKSITVEVTNKGTLRVSGVSTVKHNRTFPLLNVGFFIEPPVFDEKKSVKIGAFAVQDGILSVVHAASKDSSKLHFNCICITFNPEEIVFAATDGVQIAESRKSAPVPDEGLRGSFILGLKFSNIVSKHAADIVRGEKGPDEEDSTAVVGIYVDGDNFFFRSGGTTLVGTLLNTQFPEYSHFLETDSKSLAVFNTKDFLAVLLTMQPTVDAKSHRMVVDANKKGTADLSTSSINGEAESSDLLVKTNENFILHFDSLLLQNSIRQLKGEEFELFFTEKAANVVLKSPKKDDFKALVCTLKPVS